MPQNKINIALLLGDPSGIGPELVSKLLKEEITNKANIILIGEKKILENGNKISGNSNNLKLVDSFDKINLKEGNKFFLDIKESDILDLYSGTGSFGLESLSRGAKNVYFVENDKSAFIILKKNNFL